MTEPWQDIDQIFEEAYTDFRAAIVEKGEPVIIVRRSPLLEITNFPKGLERETHALAKAAAVLFMRLDQMRT